MATVRTDAGVARLGFWLEKKGTDMNEALIRFGCVLMQKVRDEAIEEWDKILDGRMGGHRASLVRERLHALTPEQRVVTSWVIPQVVDTTLHHLLWTLEQSRELELKVRILEELSENLREVSDGLAGELYGSRGWIAKFSQQQRHVPPG